MITKFRNAWYVEFPIIDWRGREEIAQRHFKTKREAEAFEAHAAKDLIKDREIQAEQRGYRVEAAKAYLAVRAERTAELARQGTFWFG